MPGSRRRFVSVVVPAHQDDPTHHPPSWLPRSPSSKLSIDADAGIPYGFATAMVRAAAPAAVVARSMGRGQPPAAGTAATSIDTASAGPSIAPSSAATGVNVRPPFHDTSRRVIRSGASADPDTFSPGTPTRRAAPQWTISGTPPAPGGGG